MSLEERLCTPVSKFNFSLKSSKSPKSDGTCDSGCFLQDIGKQSLYKQVCAVTAFVQQLLLYYGWEKYNL